MSSEPRAIQALSSDLSLSEACAALEVLATDVRALGPGGPTLIVRRQPDGRVSVTAWLSGTRVA